MIQESVDDIFDTINPSVILHQVNALGFGSTGLMLRIRNNYPKLFQEYHSLCGWFKDYKRQEELIGKFQALPIPNSHNILCNAFTQRFLTDTKYKIDLDSWATVLRKMSTQIKNNAKNTGKMYEIHAPSKLGVGMKPEEIDLLKDVVQQFFEDDDIIFTYHI